MQVNAAGHGGEYHQYAANAIWTSKAHPHSVLSKIKQLPPSKDTLEPLIECDLGVRAIYSTMEACELKDHINNPMPVKELEDKLPTQLKIQFQRRLRIFRADL